MTFSGTGDMYDFGWNNQPWISQRNSITSVDIAEGITSIGSGTFFRNYNITSVTIPASVTKLGVMAFQYASNLTKVEFAPNSQLTTLENQVFYDTPKLTEMTLPDNLTTIGIDVFQYSGLRSMAIPESVVLIGYGNFAAKSSDKLITILYCTESQKNGGVCDESKMAEYFYDDETQTYQWDPDSTTIIRYEKEGNHYNIYDDDGNIVAQYKSFANFGTDNTYQRRTSYTPAEAAQHVNHTNNNKVIFTFK